MVVPRSHLWPFQVFVQNEARGFLVRPYIDANLYDRMSTRPFLNSIEKVSNHEELCLHLFNLLQDL